MKQKTGRKLLAFLLTLAMVLGLMPGMGLTALAAGTTWNNNNSLPTAAGNYMLDTDVTISSTWNVPAGETTIDLNGHGIKYTGSIGSVFHVPSGAVLNLEDSGNTEHKFTYTPLVSGLDAGLATVNDSASENYQTFTGGYITGGKGSLEPGKNDSQYWGGAVMIAGGTFNMYGGTLIGNSVKNGGGAVYLIANSGATFNMYGGKIMYNKAQHGGAIRINSNTMTMYGGEISHNACDWDGGGVHASSGTFTMTGGKIEKNVAGHSGSGVHQGNLTISGTAEIRDNVISSSNKNGAGIFKPNSLSISGTPTITGNNLPGEKDSNVYLGNGKKITISGELTCSAPIGVSMETPSVFTDSSNTAYNDASKFTSDSPSYIIGKNAAGQLLLGEPCTLSYDANGATSGVVPTSNSTYVSGSTVTVLGNTGSLQKTYSLFIGWNTKEDGSGTSYAAGETFDIHSDTTLYAKWAGVTDDQKPKAKTGLTYTNQPQELVTAPKELPAGYIEVQYALSTDANNQPDSSDYKDTIPTGIDAGDYYVWYKYKAIGDNDHADSEAAMIEVTISEKAVTPEVKFDVTTMDLKIGQTGTIAATVEPSDAVVTWSSDKETVATADNTGKVTAVGAGTAKITATITVAGTQYKAECTVTVAEGEPSDTDPVISIGDLPDAIDGESYNYTLTASGAQPITWSITAGALPDGLSLESDTGKISGTPTSTGTSTFTVTATNTYGSASKEMSITVQAGSTIIDTEGSAPDDQKTAVESDPSVVRDIVGDAAGGVTESDTVRLILKTDSRDEGSVTGEEKEAVDAIKGAAEGSGLVVGTFVDLTLSYEVKNANGEITSSGQISQTARPLTVKFPIPAGLQKAGRLFKIFRFHVSDVTELGSGSGDAVDVSTDLFSIYAIAYTDDAAPVEPEESSEKPHVHTFAWDTRNATADTDGEMRYQCTKCGMIQTRVPISAYYIFNKETTEKIRAAKQGATVKIETRRWISFHKMVAEALAERKDVTVEVSFLDQGHKGNPYTFTIPAGTDLTPLFDESGFAGFMYLGNRFGLKEN